MSEKKQWETKDMSGSSFTNRRKQKDTHADYTGEIRIEGKLYWLNTWIKTTQSGDTYLSHSANPKEEKQSSEPARSASPFSAEKLSVSRVQPAIEPSPDDDSIPF